MPVFVKQPHHNLFHYVLGAFLNIKAEESTFEISVAPFMNTASKLFLLRRSVLKNVYTNTTYNS